MRIGELSKLSGLSIDTLRYYEEVGLIDPPPRNASGWREYDPDILRWFEFLDRMKAAGMSINEMIEYANLRKKGSDTFVQRRKMLEERQKHVSAELEKLKSIHYILEEKIGLYKRLERGEEVDPISKERAFRRRD